MPDRIIRERARRSSSLQRLSDAAERAWWRLIVVVDDHGRFEADPELLLVQLFERRPAGWSAVKLARVLAEWEAEAVGLVHRYAVPSDPRVYGHVVTFKTWQRARDSKPKYPDPPCKGKSYAQLSTPCLESLHILGTIEKPRQSQNAASRRKSRQVAAYSESVSECVSESESDARAATRGEPATRAGASGPPTHAAPAPPAPASDEDGPGALSSRGRIRIDPSPADPDRVAQYLAAVAAHRATFHGPPPRPVPPP